MERIFIRVQIRFRVARFVTLKIHAVPGFLEKEVTAVPLYLSRVRFAIVRGARDKTHDYWKEYTRDLDDQIKYRYLTYGLSYGNPGTQTWLL